MNSIQAHELGIDQVKDVGAPVPARQSPASSTALRHMVAEARSRAIVETRASELFRRASVALGTAILAAEVGKAEVEVLIAHIEALERRLSERPALSYEGVFAPGREYVPHESVTWGGNMYVAMENTSKKPDGPDSGWKLAVRRGRDARNARP